MRDNVKVSIIIPVYNAENYISRCLNSIIDQTYKNWEIIALDDGSTDSSWQILSKYKEKYPDVINAVHQENMGVSKTRNKGIQLATGDYLMLMDNDDYIDDDYIEQFVNVIVEHDDDVVIGGYRRPNSKGKVIEEIKLENCEYSKYKIVAAWAKIYKLSYIKNNKIEFLPSNIGEDIHFTIQAVLLTDKIRIIDYIGYNWYYNDQSVSNTTHKNMDNNLEFDLLLNKTYESIEKKVNLNNVYIEYYFIKLIVWYFLYASKGSNYKIILDSLNKYFSWLGDKFPNYNKNKLLSINKPRGEILLNRVAVYVFVKLYKYKLIKLFLYVYSKL